jgi:hypothetical protein
MTLPTDNIRRMIVPMILYQLQDHLTTSLKDEVPADNPTRAETIKVGLFQENPVKTGTYVAISGGAFDDPDYRDGRIDHEDLNAISIQNLPVGEIGGGEYWYRRGSCRFGAYFVKNRFAEDKAADYAYDFYGRIQKAVEDTSVHGLTDDYGEKAYKSPIVESSTFFESGGNNQFIWRGMIYWRVLTWRT